MRNNTTDDCATLSITVDREIQVPVDLLSDDPANESDEVLADRAGDWFWNYWQEALANERPPSKADVSVKSVDLPSLEAVSVDPMEADTNE